MDTSASTVATPRGSVGDHHDAGPGDAPDEASRPAHKRSVIEPVGRWWVVFALAIVITPMVVATSRALLSGWLPLGDNGILLVRARDVGTPHHPLLGSWTSASIEAGQNINNPGPLYFDLIALPVKLLGPWVGLAVGVMLVNIAAVAFAVVVAGRLAGRLAMLSLAAAIAALEWSVGSEMLFDVWQPNALLWPTLAFAAACWGLATGRLWYLPFAAGIGSLLVQTHLSYAYLVTLGVLGAGAMALGRLRRDSAAGLWRPSRGPGIAAPLGVTFAVVALGWVQPLIEQFTASGRGNLAALLDVSGQDTNRLGPRLGLRLAAEVLALPPFWGRPSYDTAIPWWSLDDREAVPVVSLPAAVAAIGVLLALLATALWLNRIGRRPALTAMVAMALVLLVGSLVSVMLMPEGVGGLLIPHQMRWLWPLGAFVFASLLATMVSRVAARPDAARAPWLAGVAAGVVAGVGVVAAIAALPTHASASGPTADRDALPFAKELTAGVERLEGRGPVLFDTSTLVFAEPYSGVMFAELQDRGIPFYFEDEVWVHQLGEARRYHDNAELRIWLQSGANVVPPDELPPGVEEVVAVRGVSGEDTADRRTVALYAAPVALLPDDRSG